MLEVVGLGLGGVVDVEGLLGDEGGDVFIAFVGLGRLGGFLGRHLGSRRAGCGVCEEFARCSSRVRV